MGKRSHDIPERHHHWNTAPIKTCFLRSHQAITKLTTCKNDALVKMALLTLDKQKDLMCWDPFFYGVTCSALGYKLSLQVRHCFRHIHETTTFFRTYENENGENSKHMTELRFVHAVTAGDSVKFLSVV